VVAQRLLAALDRRGEPFPVALGREVVRELRDEQPSVCEDQDAECARRVDEPCGGDRLAGCGGMPEAVAAYSTRILLRRELLVLVFLLARAEDDRLVFILFVGLGFG